MTAPQRLTRRTSVLFILCAPLLALTSARVSPQTAPTPQAPATARDSAAATRELSVAVVDEKNNLVTGLKREAFTVFDGKEQ